MEMTNLILEAGMVGGGGEGQVALNFKTFSFTFTYQL
jgi:ABC-type methionine transport system permease subunit